MGTARFYEFLAVEHPDLNVFILQPGVIRTALYEKGKLELDDTIDSGMLDALDASSEYNRLTACSSTSGSFLSVVGEP